MGITLQSKNSFMDTLRNFNFKSVLNTLKLMNINWVEVGTFFAGGILAGFLFRRYFKDVVTWLLIILVIVVLLDYAGIIAIRWDTVQGVVGTSPTETLDALFQSALVWIKRNVPLVISLVIGFTVGIKVG
jgi:uncharacterized membrane protein (Fun14 family)